MANIHDLDGVLCFGDQKQIAAVRALEAGQRPCRDCGALCDPDPNAMELRDGVCRNCYADHCCRRCGEFFHYADEDLSGGICRFCLEEAKDA